MNEETLGDTANTAADLAWIELEKSLNKLRTDNQHGFIIPNGPLPKEEELSKRAMLAGKTVEQFTKQFTELAGFANRTVAQILEGDDFEKGGQIGGSYLIESFRLVNQDSNDDNVDLSKPVLGFWRSHHNPLREGLFLHAEGETILSAGFCSEQTDTTPTASPKLDVAYVFGLKVPFDDALAIRLAAAVVDEISETLNPAAALSASSSDWTESRRVVWSSSGIESVIVALVDEMFKPTIQEKLMKFPKTAAQYLRSAWTSCTNLLNHMRNPSQIEPPANAREGAARRAVDAAQPRPANKDHG